MVTKREDGGPAFPVRDGLIVKDGMTLRDWFAGQALTGAQQWDAILNGRNSIYAKGEGPRKLAELAYAIADAMLAERTK